MNAAFTSSGFTDGTGVNAVNDARQAVRLWCTEAITAGNWVAEYSSDTTNPGAKTGESYRTGISTNTDALFNTVGVAAETTTGAGWCSVYVGGRVQSTNVNAPSIGDDLIISNSSGRATTYADGNTNVRILGRCMSTPASNACDVLLYPHPKFA